MLTPKARYFSLKGSIHLQAVCTEQMSLSEVVDSMLVRDLDQQIAARLEIMREEAQNQLVDPFKLHSDVMQRANNFNIHMPARMSFKTGEDSRFLGGLVPFNDW